MTIVMMMMPMKMSKATKATVTLVKVCFTAGVSADQLDDCQLFYGKAQVFCANSYEGEDGDGDSVDGVGGDNGGDNGDDNGDDGNLAKMM